MWGCGGQHGARECNPEVDDKAQTSEGYKQNQRSPSAQRMEWKQRIRLAQKGLDYRGETALESLKSEVSR